MPEVDKPMSVDLGGEIVSAKVLQVLSADVIVVKVTGIVIDKSGHGYKKGSIVPMQRTDGVLQETWTPISERETREKEHLERVKQQVASEAEERRREAYDRANEKYPLPISGTADPLAAGTNIADKPAGTNLGDAPSTTVAEAPRKVLGPRRSKISRDIPRGS